MRIRITCFFLSCLVVLAYNGIAQIRLPKVLGSNMVLQRNQDVPIWGWAQAGKTVSVEFAGQHKQAPVNTDGSWKVTLSSLKASDEPRDLVIASDTSKITLTNVLVGEVWLASGQSNMEYVMKNNYAKPVRCADSAALELSTHNPNIRLFKVEKKLSLPDVTTKYGWQESQGDPLAEISAPAYFFAKCLYNTLHVPIGIISSSWGGSRIEPWTPAEAYGNLPAFKDDVAKQPLMIDSMAPGKDYQSMIKPLAPFALHGFLWYQGESNCMLNEPGMRYSDKMQALVDSWREEWGNDKLPFYSVLIAPYYYTKRKDHVPHTPGTEAYFWEQQEASVAIPHTEIISVSDLVDDLKNIHPSYKWEVGRRLALVALAKDYGYKKTVYSGPRYKKMSVGDNKITLYFDHANGLKTSDGKPVDNFAVAGADGKFVPATAEINGNTVVVSATGVSDPKTVRFAWNETAMPNLVNSAGLPAFPFRTDALGWTYHK